MPQPRNPDRMLYQTRLYRSWPVRLISIVSILCTHSFNKPGNLFFGMPFMVGFFFLIAFKVFLQAALNALKKLWSRGWDMCAEFGTKKQKLISLWRIYEGIWRKYEGILWRIYEGIMKEIWRKYEEIWRNYERYPDRMLYRTQLYRSWPVRLISIVSILCTHSFNKPGNLFFGMPFMVGFFFLIAFKVFLQAALNALKKLWSRGWDMCVEFGTKKQKLISFSSHKRITSGVKCVAKLSPARTLRPFNLFACGKNTFLKRSVKVMRSIHPLFVRLYEEPSLQQSSVQHGSPFDPFWHQRS